MSALTIADYHSYANLQMAAEALYNYDATKQGATLTPGALRQNQALDADNLTTGNEHASKFTATEVTLSGLASDWIVVEHKSNTTTGFSGTLFKRVRSDPTTGAIAGELVLSFRSTEFIDDAARDNEATNKLEISEKGWAFGQLSDMENWYQSLVSAGKIDGPLSVTGYSLGGHLATAFNLMHPGAAQQVVTFNGAGVGRIGVANDLPSVRSTLLQMVQGFSGLRAEAEQIGLGRLLQSEYGRAAYQSLKSLWSPDLPLPGILAINSILALPNGGTTEVFSDLALLRAAWARVEGVYKEAHRAPALASGSTDGVQNPARIPDTYVDEVGLTRLAIAGESLDYQLAVLVTAKQYDTSALSIAAGLDNTFIGKTMGAGSPLANQVDVVGTEMDAAIAAAMVSNSQVHYGEDVPLFIEDQPGYRGSAPLDSAITSFVNASVKLLVDGYNTNDFGDTHSLVLLIDSLSVMGTLARIDPTLQSRPDDIARLFQAATASKARFQSGQQGIAEGDTLETVVNALGKLFLGQTYEDTLRLVTDGLNVGNTWWRPENREKFYQALEAINTAVPGDSQCVIAALTEITAAGLRGLTIGGDTDALAYRYALQELIPFAVLGDNSLYAKFNTHHELDLYDPATGTGTLTERWIEDRAAMLAAVITANTNDTRSGDTLVINPTAGDTELYKDLASGITLRDGPTALDPKRIIFGGDNPETIKGGSQADHLYGGAGNDVLSGNGGDDYLEGGPGDDSLRGGVGADTYRIDKNSGTDTIIDYAAEGLFDSSHSAGAGDGLGSILYNGTALSGALTQDGTQRGLYHSAANPDFIVRFVGNPGERGDLVIIDPDGARIILRNWKTGELGLSLATTASTVQTTDLAGTEDADNANLSGQPHGGSLVATAPNQKVYGYGGSDQITLGFAGDIGYGGSGNDIIRNAGGEQSLYGEDGNDILIASSGNDTLDGGNGDDALQGGADDDVLDGGDGNDALQGGADDDVLDGGDGNDRLYGCGKDDTQFGGKTPSIMHSSAGGTRRQGRVGAIHCCENVGAGGAAAHKSLLE